MIYSAILNILVFYFVIFIANKLFVTISNSFGWLFTMDGDDGLLIWSQQYPTESYNSGLATSDVNCSLFIFYSTEIADNKLYPNKSSDISYLGEL